MSLPYSPEYAELESNTALLERLREMTGGQAYEDDETALAEAARSRLVFRPAGNRVRGMLPLWHWPVALACLLLLADVAVRRLALEPGRLTVAARSLWARLRDRPLPQLATQPIGRTEVQSSAVAAQRFEGGPSEAAPSADAPTAQQPPAPRPASEPAPQGQPDDFLAELQRAKRRVWEERDKDKR